MGKRILNELKNWTKGEIIFYSIVAFFTFGLVIVPGIVLKFQQPHIIAFGVFAFIAFVLTTKKTFVGYSLMIAMLVWYAFICYGEEYYSEIFICGLFFLPYLVTEIINWFKNINKDTKFTKKSIIIEASVGVVTFGILFYGAYNLYSVIGSNWLIVASLCTCFTALAVYFSTYKDKMFSWVLLTVYLGLMTAGWVLSSAFSNITYAGVLFSFLGMFIVALRKTIIEIISFVKRMKSLKKVSANETEVVETKGTAEQVSEAVEETEEQTSETEEVEETKEVEEPAEASVVVEEKEVKKETPKKSSSKKSTNKKSTNKKSKK